MKNRCVICKNDAGQYRVCVSCYTSRFIPCRDCGKQTIGITKFGKEACGLCASCSVRKNAPSRAIGIKCVVCGDRFPNDGRKAHAKSVCDKCLCIKTNCPVCGSEMATYKAKGYKRKVCSQRCAILSRPKEAMSASSRKAQKTRFAGHVYKSHQNRIARRNKEYKEWRESVYKRDNFTCQKCGAHNFAGSGKTIKIHPHHIKPFATHPELRYDTSNGVTLCEKCHAEEHKHKFIGRSKKKTQSNLF